MSSLGYLENLNNKDLRAKCIEFGLPNVPVTDSSRSVLIRKLLAAMGEGDGRKRTANRRETVHASPTRNRSTAQSHSPGRNQNNNRSTAQSHSPGRTQNNTRSTAQSHSPSRNQNNNVNNNRRTVAATNYKQQEALGTASFTAPPSPPAITKVRNSSIRENIHIVPMEVDLRDCSDEEDYTFSKQSTSAAPINYVYNNAPTYNQQRLQQQTPTLSMSKTNVISTSFNQETQPSFHVQDRQYNSYIKPMQMPPAPPAQQRANRSASLSKSGVMTTSYCQETVPLSSQYEEDVEDEGVVKSISYDKVPSTYDRTQYQSLMQKSNTQKLPFEPLATATTLAYNAQNYGGNPLNSTSRYSALDTNNQYNLPPVRNISPPSRKTMLPPSRPTLTSPTRQTMLPPSRPTISSPQNRLYPTLPTLHSTTYGLPAEEQEEEIIESDEDEELSGSDDQVETPFISDFTRKLNSTQPETFGRNYTKPVSPALRASYSSADGAGYKRNTYETTDSLRRSGGYNSGSQHYYDRADLRKPLQARRSIGHDDDDDAVAASFQQFLTTLNNKYHLKQFFIAFMIFVLSVFVYVVFLQK